MVAHLKKVKTFKDKKILFIDLADRGTFNNIMYLYLSTRFDVTIEKRVKYRKSFIRWAKSLKGFIFFSSLFIETFIALGFPCIYTTAIRCRFSQLRYVL